MGRYKKYCSVRGCNTKQSIKSEAGESAVRFYSFPKDDHFKKLWVRFCDSRRAISKSGLVCSKHFEEKYKFKSFINKTCTHSPKTVRNLIDHAIPTLHGPGTTEGESMQCEQQHSENLETNHEPEELMECEPQNPQNLEAITELDMGEVMAKVDEHMAESFLIEAMASASPNQATCDSRNLSSEASKPSLERIDKIINENEILLQRGEVMAKVDEHMAESFLIEAVASASPNQATCDSRNLSSEASKPSLERIDKIINENEILLQRGEVMAKADEHMAESFLIEAVASASPNQATCDSRNLSSEESNPLLERIDKIINENEILLQRPTDNPQLLPDIKTRQSFEEELRRMTTESRALQSKYSELINTTGKLLEEKEELRKQYEEEKDAECKKLRELVKQLKENNKELKAENVKLRHELKIANNKNEKYEAIINRYFTVGQRKRLMEDKTNSRLRWCNEDIASAISLRCASIKGYRYLKYQRNYPLPHVRTLRRWAQKVCIEEGVMNTVLSLMEQKGRTMKKIDRLTILCYDEMSTNDQYCLDRGLDKIYGENAKVQVLMARGLIGYWKQPIAYFFDTDMTKDLLFDILRRMHKIKFDVVGITSDLGGENRSFHKQLNITCEYVSFIHPSSTPQNQMKVFCFADAPHLIKLARNHFLDEGFLFSDTEIRRDIIDKVLKVSKKEITVAHRLSASRHLDVQGAARQRVAPAAELMSNTTAEIIKHCCETEKISVRNYPIVVQVIKSIATWFDLFNNKDKENQLKNRQAYGLDLENQNKELESLVMVIGKMKKIKILKSGKNTETNLPFQNGMLQNIKALQELFLYVKERYGVEYILTSKLNQDPLENFFGYMRGMGGTNDHPLPTEFKQRIKLYILGKHHSAVFTMNKNSLDSVDEECLVTPSKTFQNQETVAPPASASENTPNEESFTLMEIDDEFLEDNEGDSPDIPLIDTLCKMEMEEPQGTSDDKERNERAENQDRDDEEADQEEAKEQAEYEKEVKAVTEIWKTLKKKAETAEDQLGEEGFEYLAGYVAHRYRIKYSHLGMKTNDCHSADNDWLQLISKGNLIRPDREFLNVLKYVEAVFLRVHGQDKDFMKKGPNAISYVLKLAQYLLKKVFSEEILKKYPEVVIKCFIRVRTYIRIRYCNRRLKIKNQKNTVADKKFNNKKNKLTNKRKSSVDTENSEEKKIRQEKQEIIRKKLSAFAHAPQKLSTR